MTNKKERESGHIDPGRPVSSLSREELAHLSSCQFCREQIALQTEKQELLAAPARMKSEILSKLNRPEVQIIAKSNRISKKLELFYFSLRVGTAVLCAEPARGPDHCKEQSNFQEAGAFLFQSQSGNRRSLFPGAALLRPCPARGSRTPHRASAGGCKMGRGRPFPASRDSLPQKRRRRRLGGVQLCNRTD